MKNFSIVEDFVMGRVNKGDINTATCEAAKRASEKSKTTSTALQLRSQQLANRK